MSLTKRPTSHGPYVPDTHMGWREGSHVWWIIGTGKDVTKRHGLVSLSTRDSGLDAETPWVDILWDDGGTIGAVPRMMTDLCMRAGWQVLSPSAKQLKNGDRT